MDENRPNDLKGSNTLRAHCEDLIGRMYRYWLTGNEPKARIRLIAIDESSGTAMSDTFDFRPNDQLYLMVGTNLKGSEKYPVPSEPLFEQYGESFPPSREGQPPDWGCRLEDSSSVFVG